MTMKQLIFLLTICLIPFLMNAQGHDGTGNPIPITTTASASYGESAGTTGNNSSFFGANAGAVNTGTFNTFVGSQAGKVNIAGRLNTFVGGQAGFDNRGGIRNTFVGVNAGYSSRGHDNTFLGVSAGLNNTTGQRNVFIGFTSGQNETGSNKLYIENSSTSLPLIYGDFENNYVVINGGESTVASVPDASAYGLYVTKGILAEKVKVALQTDGVNWSDYVFEEDYDLNTVEEVKDFIEENGHLPNVPSAEEVVKNGVDMVEMDATLLRQIEELWLHVIELKKENEALKEEINELKQ